LIWFLHTAEDLMTLGASAAAATCIFVRLPISLFVLLAIPALGFAYGFYAMVALPEEDAASTSALIPLFGAIWPSIGAIAVAVPLLPLRILIVWLIKRE